MILVIFRPRNLGRLRGPARGAAVAAVFFNSAGLWLSLSNWACLEIKNKMQNRQNKKKVFLSVTGNYRVKRWKKYNSITENDGYRPGSLARSPPPPSSHVTQARAYTLVHTTPTVKHTLFGHGITESQNQWARINVCALVRGDVSRLIYTHACWGPCVIKKILEAHSALVPAAPHPIYALRHAWTQTHTHTHTQSCWIKTPVIQNTQTGWQPATCVSQVLSVFRQQAPVSRQDDEPPDRNELCVCKQQAGGRRGGEERGGRGDGDREEIETVWEKQRGNGREVGEGKVIFIHSNPRPTTGFALLGSILFHTDLLLTDISIGGCYFPSAAFSLKKKKKEKKEQHIPIYFLL